MRSTYWHRHPRNFVNECAMLKASTADQMRDLAEQGFERLTIAQARRHLAHINAENSAWGSNRAFGIMRFADVQTVTEFEAAYS